MKNIFLVIASLFFCFAWIVIGVSVLPYVASTTEEGSLIPIFTVLGIFSGAFIILYILYSTLIEEKKEKRTDMDYIKKAIERNLRGMDYFDKLKGEKLNE
jgi:predicted membrane protein